MKSMLLITIRRLMLSLSLVLVCATMACQENAQENDEFTLYRKVFSAAEQIKNKSKVGLISKEAYKCADQLGDGHPSAYFDAAIDNMSKSRFNDASFLFYVGRLRYRYYNSANPEYKNGEDGAVLASLTAISQEPLNVYLKTEIDNFIAILDSSKNYYKRKDYSFYPRSKNPQKFDEQWQGIQILIDDLKANKATHTKNWNEQIKEYKSMLSEAEKMDKK